MANPLENSWALILGASSGFGEAAALELAEQGMNIFGVHLDRKGTMPHVEDIQNQIKEKGRQSYFFNLNASDPDKRNEVLVEMEQVLDQSNNPGSLKVLIHSLAFGTLKPYIADDERARLNSKNFDMTLDVMAHCLVYWTQEVVARKLDGRRRKDFRYDQCRWAQNMADLWRSISIKSST